MEQKLIDESFARNEIQSMLRDATTQTDEQTTEVRKTREPQENIESTPRKQRALSTRSREEDLLQKRKMRNQARALNDLELILEHKKE